MSTTDAPKKGKGKPGVTKTRETVLRKRKSIEALQRSKVVKSLRNLKQRKEKEVDDPNPQRPEKPPRWIYPSQLVSEFKRVERQNRQLQHRKKKAAILLRREELNGDNVAREIVLVTRTADNRSTPKKSRSALMSLGLPAPRTACFHVMTKKIKKRLMAHCPHLTLAYPTKDRIRELLLTRAFVRIGSNRIPLSDNGIVERKLGEFGIVCVEDMVLQVTEVGPHVQQVLDFLWPFHFDTALSEPLAKKLAHRGSAGRREDGAQFAEYITKRAIKWDKQPS